MLLYITIKTPECHSSTCKQKIKAQLPANDHLPHTTSVSSSLLMFVIWGWSSNETWRHALSTSHLFIIRRVSDLCSIVLCLSSISKKMRHPPHFDKLFLPESFARSITIKSFTKTTNRRHFQLSCSHKLPLKLVSDAKILLAHFCCCLDSFLLPSFRLQEMENDGEPG